MQSLLELATSLGCKATFVADNLEYDEPYVRALQRRGVEVLFHPYVRSIPELLTKRGREFDVVVLSRHYVAARHEHRLPLPLADRVDDLVLQDPGEPRPHARALREALASAQRRDERLLHDVLRQVRIPQLQMGDSQQIAAMPVELDSEKRGVQGCAFARRVADIRAKSPRSRL